MIAPSGHQFEIAHGNLRAVVAEVGATLRQLRSGDVDLLEGFGADEPVSDSRGQVLAPWPNRLEDGRYAFEGTEASCALDEPERHNAIHGLVRWLAWDLIGSAQNVATLGCVLQPQPGYPWRLRLAVEYRLTRSGLVVTTTATTDGPVPAPFGLGFHPYIGLGLNAADELRLRIPARSHLVSDSRGLPIGSELVAGSPFDFVRMRPVGSIRLDTAFCELERSADGRASIEVARPDGRYGVTMWLDSSFTCVMAYTGDILPEARRRRAAVALEPMTCPPNALRSGAGIIRLEPGVPWTGRWGIDLA